MVDNKAIGFMPGVTLSYLTEDQQSAVCHFLTANAIKSVSLKQSEALKESEDCSDQALREIFGLSAKPKPARKKIGKATASVIEQRFAFEEYDDKEIADIVDKALLRYFAREETD